MNDVFLKINRSVGILILGVFVFTFLHSEVGFLEHNDNNHSSHDHCTIVNGSTTANNETYHSDLTKLKANLGFNARYIIQEDQKALAFYSGYYNPHYLQKSNKVYLHNTSFLI
jgi:hypothetical protein